MNTCKFDDMKNALGLSTKTISKLKKKFASEEEAFIFAFVYANEVVYDAGRRTYVDDFVNAALEKGYIFKMSDREKALYRLAAQLKWACAPTDRKYFENKKGELALWKYQQLRPLDDEVIDGAVSYLESNLTPQEFKIVQLRFGFIDGKSQCLEAVGSRVDMTREYVRLFEAKAIRKLRHPKHASFRDSLILW